MNLNSKLKEVHYNILLEGSMSHIFYLDPGYIFMTLNVNNNEKLVFQNVCITLKMNKDLNQNVETRFPRGGYIEHSLAILQDLKQY